MTDNELLKQFDEDFDQLCYDSECDKRDCRKCSTYWELFEDYKQELGYMPTIQVGLD